jgi:hypothetical protein
MFWAIVNAHLQEHYTVEYSLWYEAPCMFPAVGLDAVPHPSQRQATYKVLHTTRCILQPNAPEDGRNCCPKYVELTWNVNKLPIVVTS